MSRRGKTIVISGRSRSQSGLLRHNRNAAITDEHRRQREARRRVDEIEERRRREREEWDLDRGLLRGRGAAGEHCFEQPFDLADSTGEVPQKDEYRDL